MDTKRKALLKTVTWRLIAITISSVIAYLYTKSVSDSLELVLIANAISMVVYYYHERVWDKIIN